MYLRCETLTKSNIGYLTKVGTTQPQGLFFMVARCKFMMA